MISEFGQDEILVKKREYKQPQLVRYGAMSELTQAGASGTLERDHSSQVGQCADNSVTKKLCNAAGSDNRIKQGVVRIGSHPLGFGLYLFDYKPEFRDTWGHSRQFGVMAQEVQAVKPEAVCVHADGYLMVDYGLLGITRTVH